MSLDVIVAALFIGFILLAFCHLMDGPHCGCHPPGQHNDRIVNQIAGYIDLLKQCENVVIADPTDNISDDTPGAFLSDKLLVFRDHNRLVMGSNRSSSEIFHHYHIELSGTGKLSVKFMDSDRNIHYGPIELWTIDDLLGCEDDFMCQEHPECHQEIPDDLKTILYGFLSTFQPLAGGTRYIFSPN